MNEISARVALRELTERYARGVDRRRPADVVALFSADGALLLFDGDTPRAELRGPAAIERALARLERYRVTTHILGQQFVDTLDLEAGRASAETYCMGHHLLDGPPAVDHLMAMRYLDTFVRTGEGWRFAERRLVVDWETELPLA